MSAAWVPRCSSRPSRRHASAERPVRRSGTQPGRLSGNKGTESTGLTKPDDGDDRMHNESENVAHGQIPLLILFTKSLNVGFAIRVEEVLAALLPGRFEFGCGDVPIRPTFLGNGT